MPNPNINPPVTILRSEWQAMQGKMRSLEERLRKLELKQSVIHLDPELQRNLYERGETR